MDFGMPTSLTDIATDGLIAQADIDTTTHARFGPITAVEFSGPSPADTAPDAPVQLRLTYASGTTATGTGTRVAAINEGQWTWLTECTAQFDILELHEPTRATDTHIAAARTLFGNAPALLSPHKSGATSVVVVNGTPPASDTRRAIMHAADALDGADLTRALTSFAASRGLEFDGSRFSDGTEVTIDGGQLTGIGPGLTFADVFADGILTSIEHQFFLHGRYPNAPIQPDLDRGRALIQAPQPFEVEMQVMATVRDGQATWAWADPRLQGRASADAAAQVREFGRNQGIVRFARSRMPLSLVDDTLVACKPVLGMWTHATVALDPQTTGYVLLRGPQLALPPASPRAVEATVSELPAHLPAAQAARARAAYAEFRRINAAVLPGNAEPEQPGQS